MTLEEIKDLRNKLYEYWESIDPENILEQKKLYDAIEEIDDDIEWCEEAEKQADLLGEEDTDFYESMQDSGVPGEDI